MIQETKLEKDEMTFHFVPEIGENNDTCKSSAKSGLI
jgi:hypothetical protein